jgi:hypothetical protein
VAEVERTKERIAMNGHFKELDPLNFWFLPNKYVEIAYQLIEKWEDVLIFFEIVGNLFFIDNICPNISF